MFSSIVSLLLISCWLAARSISCYPASAPHGSLAEPSKDFSDEAKNTSSCKIGPGKESHQVVSGQGSYWQYQIFMSAPFNPPELDITTNGEPLAPGLLFMTPGNFGPTLATKDTAPMIMTDKGQLVWKGPSTNVTVTDLHVATFEKQPVLVYWQGPVSLAPNGGHGYGSITFLDTSYNNILTVCPKLGLVTPDNTSYPCEADVHEVIITKRGTLLFAAHNVTKADLSSIGGSKDGWVYDSLIYDIQPRTGEILFRWSSLEHVPVSETKMPLATGGQSQLQPLNYFMVNSAVDVGDGYLINGRHCSAIYLVDKQGDVVWTLDGETGGDFGPLPSGGQFSWQHHVRAHNVESKSMVITMLNNHGSAFVPREGPVVGLSLLLPLPPSQSRPVPVQAAFTDPPSSPLTQTNSQGSNVVLSNGNHLIDYGQIPVAREYGPAGVSSNNNGSGNIDVRWQARFGQDNLVQNYRLFKQEWRATPTGTRPSLFVDWTGSNGTVASSSGQDGCSFAYASWNGVTHVSAWRVYAGDQESTLGYVGSVPFKGFETRFVVGAKVVQVGAVVEGGMEFRSNMVSVS